MSTLRGIYAILIKKAQKNYANDSAQDIYLTMVFSLFQFIFLWFMPPYRPLHIETSQLFNPIMFGIITVLANVLFFSAIRIGPTALTNIIITFSMLVPIFFGLIFLGEMVTAFQIIGIILVMAALFFFNVRRNPDKLNNNKNSSTKWLITAILSALATGCAVSFTKCNSIQFPEYFKEYLILLNATAVICSLPYVVFAYQKKKIRLIPDIRFLYIFALLAVIQNIFNIIYTIVVGQFDSALFFPVMGIATTLAVVIFSHAFLKEKLTRMAYIGVVLSIVAIALLSIK
jgi:drug/metabolite transporter (DMT)-like permease